ncbi:39S ribosomal protein L44, mitochondrial [Strongyloides ratti]|uniref:Large ribosomal subunit protein mL44 n=1 Tax=Strongyloides ratti TaxID=34506 RepID=A0A090L7U4_STRRB|nr:39S ribosomal protein L44, mitochondrial [Strongyloides ratti]CEF65802.1 39S ribosomal protein L44, mitochondrial [Strongyloides ratti]
MFKILQGSVKLSQPLTKNTLIFERNLRSVWERGYLKDLYHRRVLVGAEPELHRSVFPNWNYNAEVFALSHRISSSNIDKQKLVTALTFSDFFDIDHKNLSINDIEGYGRMSLNGTISEEEYNKHNVELIEEGSTLLENYVDSYLRYHLPNAPEEFINAFTDRLTNDEELAKVSDSLGLRHLIRTKTFPVSTPLLADSILAIIGVLPSEHAIELIKNTIIPNILSIPIDNVYPLAHPLPVLEALLKSQRNVSVVEARLLRKTGALSAMPCYVVGIYGDKKLYGQMPGESIDIATDLAATEALLKLWGIDNGKQFLFGNQVKNDDLKDYIKPNYSLLETVGDGVSLKLLTEREIIEEPLKVIDLIENYQKNIEPVVGIPLRRRLRHKFSRGSLFKRSFRYLVKPRIFTIA